MIKYIFIDVDGTLTDGQVYIGNQGELCKGFYVRDGLGIQMAIKKGIEPIIFTSRESEIVINRCKELGIKEIYQKIPNKKDKLIEYVEDKGLQYSEIAYIADDLNDLESMKYVGANGGILGCPNDAVDEIIDICDFISNKPGGKGAVREFIEFIMKSDD